MAAYLNLLIDARSVEIQHHSHFGTLLDARLVAFDDGAHELRAGEGVHGHVVLGVARSAGWIGCEGPAPYVGVEGFGCA